MLCWQCGAEVPADALTCPECDSELGDAPGRGVRRGEQYCPSCGCSWEQEEKACPVCGFTADEDENSLDRDDA